jgi:hypothetical protein
MGLTRKVLQHAARHSFIEHIPEFPKVGVEDKPRGWFNVGEYKAITKPSSPRSLLASVLSGGHIQSQWKEVISALLEKRSVLQTD